MHTLLIAHTVPASLEIYCIKQQLFASSTLPPGLVGDRATFAFAAVMVIIVPAEVENSNGTFAEWWFCVAFWVGKRPVEQATPALLEAAAGIAVTDRQMSGMTFAKRTWGELARHDEVKSLNEH